MNKKTLQQNELARTIQEKINTLANELTALTGRHAIVSIRYINDIEQHKDGKDLIESIKKIVFAETGITIEQIDGPIRRRNIVEARQIAIKLSASHTNKTKVAIGKIFGGRDHSTIITSIKACSDKYDTEPDFVITYNNCEKRVLSLMESLNAA